MLLAILILSSGCATSGPATDYCKVAQPIYISRDDLVTDGTAVQILAHNLTWRRLCER